jgi:hypothetical protein
VGDARGDSVLFLMRSPAYVRNFASVLHELAAQAERVTVLFEERKQGADEPGLAHLRRLGQEHPGLSFELLPDRRLGWRGWTRKASAAVQDYLRYFEPPYIGAARLRSRALAGVPSPLEAALATALHRLPWVRRTLAAAARDIDSRLGYDGTVRADLERRRPRVLVVTPLVQFRSRQGDWVRAARALGIPTVLCVYSWDNLTSKGLMHALPDRVVVWNEVQRREAIELHGVPPHEVVVAGAWPYDHWLGWTASKSRDELCAELGLPRGRALVLYVCSSPFIAARERAAVIGWLRALRASADRRLASANVIVRPHPLNGAEWQGATVAGISNVVVFPPAGAEPLDDASRSDYFDSIAHADAVVGVNTSALLEAAIVDRPALALPGLRASQEELPHFRTLAGNQGAVRTAASMAEHLSQLGETLAGVGLDAAARGRFVDTFIRPPGAGPSATKRVAAAIGELCR